MNHDSSDKTHTKPKTICPEATKQDLCTNIGPKPDHYDPIPHPGAAGAGAFTYKAFSTEVALSRSLQGLGLRTLGQVGLGFIGLCSISFITCSRTLLFFHEHLLVIYVMK